MRHLGLLASRSGERHEGLGRQRRHSNQSLGIRAALSHSHPGRLLRLPQGQTLKPSGLALGAPSCTCKPEPGASYSGGLDVVHGGIPVASNSDRRHQRRGFVLDGLIVLNSRISCIHSSGVELRASVERRSLARAFVSARMINRRCASLITIWYSS